MEDVRTKGDIMIIDEKRKQNKENFIFFKNIDELLSSLNKETYTLTHEGQCVYKYNITASSALLHRDDGHFFIELYPEPEDYIMDNKEYPAIEFHICDSDDYCKTTRVLLLCYNQETEEYFWYSSMHLWSINKTFVYNNDKNTKELLTMDTAIKLISSMYNIEELAAELQKQ